MCRGKAGAQPEAIHNGDRDGGGPGATVGTRYDKDFHRAASVGLFVCSATGWYVRR